MQKQVFTIYCIESKPYKNNKISTQKKEKAKFSVICYFDVDQSAANFAKKPEQVNHVDKARHNL